MRWSRRTVIVAVSSLGLSIGGVGAAIAASDDDRDSQATGSDADRAREAALQATRGGTANSVERESEGKEAWEVEITKDGKTVDVSLDENYEQLAVETEDEDAAEDEDSDEKEDEEGADGS
jgi:hypothetical protein